ncbi:MAG: hypothetical protein KGO02_18565 [Alphaproteobacteria bacterium]|nr:hypothetical protein [Alphaproteobacteria bacterium]
MSWRPVFLTLMLTGPLLAGCERHGSATLGRIAEHAAGYALGGIAAHESERYLDHRASGQHYERQLGSGQNIQHSGRMGLVFPEADALPNPELTPGALNSAVTQANLRETICRPGGYTRSIRPDEHYTENLKREGVRQYGYPRQMGKDAFMLRNYEEDHLIGHV